MPRYFERDFDWDTLREVAAASQAAQLAESGPRGRSGDNRPSPAAAPFCDCGASAWDTFHIRHASATFFRPKRYLSEAFPELKVSGLLSERSEGERSEGGRGAGKLFDAP